MTSKVTLKCASCGGEEFVYPDKPRANDKVTCGRCGRSSTYGRIVADAEAELAKDLENAIAKRLR